MAKQASHPKDSDCDDPVTTVLNALAASDGRQQTGGSGTPSGSPEVGSTSNANPGEDGSARATAILQRIGSEFARRKKKDRIGAYAYFQNELLEQAHILVPYVISFKDLLAAVAASETALKGRGDGELGPVEYLKNYLNATKCPHCGKDIAEAA
jgi:hypothetical protein